MTLVSGSTYQIGGLTDLTSAEGSYVFSVNASFIDDQYGKSGTGSLSTSWLMDSTPPTSSVNSLPATTTATSFTVSVTGNDRPGPMEVRLPESSHLRSTCRRTAGHIRCSRLRHPAIRPPSSPARPATHTASTPSRPTTRATSRPYRLRPANRPDPVGTVCQLVHARLAQSAQFVCLVDRRDLQRTD